MSNDQVGISSGSEFIDGFNSVPVRPAYCRLWRFQMALVFSLIVLVVASLIGYVMLVQGWIPNFPKVDSPIALKIVIDDLSHFAVFILIISYFVAYFIIPKGIYNWLYDGR